MRRVISFTLHKLLGDQKSKMKRTGHVVRRGEMRNVKNVDRKT